MIDRMTASGAVRELVLASASPRRRELIQLLGLDIPVRILTSDADETIDAAWTPAEAAERLALRKAEAVSALMETGERAGAVIVGADTIVVSDGEVLGKPRDAAEARRMLEQLEGRTHEVITGVAVLSGSGAGSDVRTAHGLTRVSMKRLGAERIARYVATGEPMDKAGSYGIQGLAASFVDRIDGCYFNIVGLPLALLAGLLEAAGVRTI